MDKEKYVNTQNTILKVARDIRFLALDEFIEAINSAESIAPLLDPTAYRAAQLNLRHVKQMAQGLIDFQNSLPEMSDVIDGLIAAQQYNESRV